MVWKLLKKKKLKLVCESSSPKPKAKKKSTTMSKKFTKLKRLYKLIAREYADLGCLSKTILPHLPSQITRKNLQGSSRDYPQITHVLY